MGSRSRCSHAQRRLRLRGVHPEWLHARRRGAAVIVDVVVKDVDFPERAVGIGDPELRLPRVTALDAFLPLGAEPGGLEAALNLDELLGVSHAQARRD